MIEVGLGGRLDCTNIIDPTLCVITNISLDHMALLGASEPEIAREKAGIIKPGVPVVIGKADSEVREVFESTAAKLGAPIVFAGDSPYFSSALHSGDEMIYSDTAWGELRGELTGECQIENAATILASLDILRHKFSRIGSQAVSEGFSSVCSLTGLMGRWMKIKETPVRVVCDTGHNIGGWRYLGPTLASIADSGRLSMVLGFVNDKDISSIVDTFPRNARYYFASPSVKRGRPSEETAAVAKLHGIDGCIFPQYLTPTTLHLPMPLVEIRCLSVAAHLWSATFCQHLHKKVECNYVKIVLKIWWNKYNGITLHRKTAEAYGSLAQLNRASDYGSEGYRFESCASHFYLSRSHKAFNQSKTLSFIIAAIHTTILANV